MTSDNREQVELWSGKAGELWVKQQEAMDLRIGPLGIAALEAASVIPGEHTLDVGCGCGDTTLALARLLGKSGSVLGVDVSAPMLARAKERAAGLRDVAKIEFREVDAQVAELPQFDLAYSRFGVMFFADPQAAFTNVRKVAKRLAFVTWRTPEENEWIRVPAQALAPFISVPPVLDPRAPGPNSLSDKLYVAELLHAAGYESVKMEALDRKVHWSHTADVEDGVKFLSQLGPAAKPLSELEKPVRAEARTAMARALAPYQTESGLVLGTACWIVTAS